MKVFSENERIKWIWKDSVNIEDSDNMKDSGNMKGFR